LDLIRDLTGRNQFAVPGARTFDLAVAKSFQLTERFNLQFRSEAFDVFNHHNTHVKGFVADAAQFPGTLISVQGKTSKQPFPLSFHPSVRLDFQGARLAASDGWPDPGR